MKGVNFMSKMRNLTTLGIYVVEEQFLAFREVIVQLSGRCPALKSLGLHHVAGQLWFGLMFGRHFPEKELTLFCLEVADSFPFTWPGRISVVRLKITGKLDDASILKVTFI